MNDITQTAIQDCQAKKRELAAEVTRLRSDLEEANKEREHWAGVCSEVHDARMLADAEVIRVRAMSLWAHLRMWWAK